MIAPVFLSVPQFLTIDPLTLFEQKTKLVYPIILTHLQRHIVIEEIQNEGIQMKAMVRAVGK